MIGRIFWAGAKGLLLILAGLVLAFPVVLLVVAVGVGWITGTHVAIVGLLLVGLSAWLVVGLRHGVQRATRLSQLRPGDLVVCYVRQPLVLLLAGEQLLLLPARCGGEE